MAKMNKDAPKVFAILFNPMILRADMGLIEKAQHPFFQLSAALPRDNFNQLDAFLDRFLDHPVQFCLDPVTAVVDIMQIKFYLGHHSPLVFSISAQPRHKNPLAQKEL